MSVATAGRTLATTSKKRWCRTAANEVPGVFQRLAGLETEYAMRFEAAGPDADRSKYQLYEAVVASLRRRMPVVPAQHFKEGVFVATGGAVWFEAERPAAGGGLVEGATPECRGPRQLLACQRAQDKLLSDAARQAVVGGKLTLVKNDRDARGNVYGAQENYEAQIASGLRLAIWRTGLVLLFPLAVLTWVAILLSIIATLVYFSVAMLCYLPFQLLTGGQRSLALWLFGSDLVDGRQSCIHVPVWLETILQFATRIITAPLAIALFGLLHAVAFNQTRRNMLAFLVSRPVLAGAGLVGSAGEFFLSDKAPAINCATGFGGMLFERPIFSMGHFFKAIYADSWFSPHEYAELFSVRHRLQIAMGDSNMCEAAEYLRIGTTMLVLDAIEAGAISDAPRCQRPIATLQQIISDPDLKASYPLRDGRRATALEIQRFYLDACRDFVAIHAPRHAEARELLALWEETLDELSELQQTGNTPGTLIGKLDWVTKRHLLERAGADAPWSAKKKIDIRYHELSPDGYYQRLADAALCRQIVSSRDLERATRSAPPGSPATTRGHFIREFAASDEPVTANWKSLTIGQGRNAKSIRLSQHGPRATSRDASDKPTDPTRHRLRSDGFEIE